MTRAARDRELADYRSLSSIARKSPEALERAAELARAAEDPLVRALATAEEILRSRSLGHQQRAIVAGAELVHLADDLRRAPLSKDDRGELGRVADGLYSAACAALDVPEVSFAAIDQLVEMYGVMLSELGLRGYDARMLRARRHFVSGDEARVAALVEELLPHVNYTNGSRERMGCPDCVLSTFAWYLGPRVTPAALYQILRPAFERESMFPNEDPAYWRRIQARYGGRPTCANGFQSSHMAYGRALVYAGRWREAEANARECRPLDLDRCFLLPTVFFLELAMASGDASRVRARVELLTPLYREHEDAEEAMIAAIRLAQARAQLGARGRELDALWAFARASAERLDGRLARPRHLALVQRERATAPDFAAALDEPA